MGNVVHSGKGEEPVRQLAYVLPEEDIGPEVFNIHEGLQHATIAAERDGSLALVRGL